MKVKSSVKPICSKCRVVRRRGVVRVLCSNPRHRPGQGTEDAQGRVTREKAPSWRAGHPLLCECKGSIGRVREEQHGGEEGQEAGEEGRPERRGPHSGLLQ